MRLVLIVRQGLFLQGRVGFADWMEHWATVGRKVQTPNAGQFVYG